jgi:hypothetical protein
MIDVLQSARMGDDIIVGGGRYQKLEQSAVIHFVFSVLNLKTRQHYLIPLDFLPHGLSPNPNCPTQLVVCEKIGPRAAVIDLETMSLVETIPTDPDRYYYGHCVHSKNGDIFYATETYRRSLKGAIVIRDTRSNQVIGEFPSYGAAPHECYLIDEGKTMVVTNGGGDSSGDKPNIAYIDIDSQQLLRREHLTNRHINAGHLMHADDGSLVVVSAPRAGLGADKLGGVSIQPQGKLMRSVSSPKKVVNKMKGEALSVAIHQDVAMVTHPTGNMLTCWSTKDRRLLKKIDLPIPRGVTLTCDNRYFVVSYGPQASVVQIDTRNFELSKMTASHATYLTGSHLYNWSKMTAGLR